MFRNLAHTEKAGYCLSMLIRCCGYYTQSDDLEDTDTMQMLHWATVQPIWFWCTTEDLSVTTLRTFWQVGLSSKLQKGRLTHSKIVGLFLGFQYQCKF